MSYKYKPLYVKTPERHNIHLHTRIIYISASRNVREYIPYCQFQILAYHHLSILSTLITLLSHTHTVHMFAHLRHTDISNLVFIISYVTELVLLHFGHTMPTSLAFNTSPHYQCHRLNKNKSKPFTIIKNTPTRTDIVPKTVIIISNIINTP